ncbi:MAG: hypothetical protein IT563_22615 [Alphaproteobacteria bacterium]|nr:hypothetical protein [Alphaproteobacteria bacterium]
MLYVVLLEDEPSKADVRPKYLKDHVAYLETLLGRIRSAGPLTDTKTNAAAGGIWIVEATSADEVRTMLEADPFYKAGLRKSIRILAWKQVFADGKKVA